MSHNTCFFAGQSIKHVIALSALATFLYMTAWFLVAFRRKRIDTVDIAWGGGFILVAWLAFSQEPSSHSLIIATLVSIWGLRLAIHIWQRAKSKSTEDPRYVEISKKWKSNYWLRAYISIFLLQGLLVLIVSLPITVATGNILTNLGWLTYVGSFVWVFGFVFEAVADNQLQTFLKTPNHPVVLRTGLWRYSRHPNYFGELMQWWGIGIIALQVRHGWIGLIGPLVLTWLIVFVSGIPPIERRRTANKQYQDYKKVASSLIPLPPKK